MARSSAMRIDEGLQVGCTVLTSLNDLVADACRYMMHEHPSWAGGVNDDCR